MAQREKQSSTPGIPDSEVLRGPLASVPLRGYIVESDKERLWIQDAQGTWAVRHSDIVATQEWRGSDARFRGKPTCIFIRDGAEIFEMKPFVVKRARLPLTLNPPDEPLAIRGTETMRKLERTYFRHLGFNEVDPGPLVLIGTTVCSYDAPGGGMILAGDDCGPIDPDT